MNERTTKQLMDQIEADRYGRELHTWALGKELRMSYQTIWRALWAANLRQVKSTYKPDLSSVIKVARLKFALEHQKWTLKG